MKIIRFFKHQGMYLLFLLSLFFAPVWLFLEFSPYKEPRVTYVALIALIVSQYAYYKDKKFRKKIEAPVSEILKRELGRVPSRKEIIARSTFVIQCRGISIVTVALMIFTLSLFY